MKYFTIEELCRSDTAARRGIDNTPTPQARENLAHLTNRILDPLRAAWGRPLTVNSGYRCKALNMAVGGATTSQHLSGMAADITTGKQADNSRLFELAQRLNLPFDQLIFEKGSLKDGPVWVHISHNPDGRNRRQILYLI